MKTLSWTEISRHNSSGDCWIVVDGDVYDVTDWVSKHPGGDILAILAGEDASAMFHSSHLRDVLPMLQKFRIGKVCEYKADFEVINDEFLVTLKQRVHDYFIASGIDYRNTDTNRKSIAWTALLLFVCWAGMYLFPPWGLPAAVIMGLATCSLIGSFGHERIHGNLQPLIRGQRATAAHMNDVLWGLFIPMMPERFFQYEHIKHHLYSMDPARDYDVLALKSFVRLSPALPRRRYQAYQQYYAPLVYGIYIFLQIISGYTSAFFEKRNLLADRGVLPGIIVMSVTAVMFHIVLPIYLTDIWWVMLCSSIYFFTWQAAIYLTSGAPHMMDIQAVSDKPASWSRYVCSVTANLKCGNRFVDWLTGGLNYHLVHHLLPSIPRDHLPDVAGIVKATCEEFGYPYRNYDSFRQYLHDHYRYLQNLGKYDYPASRDEELTEGGACRIEKYACRS